MPAAETLKVYERRVAAKVSYGFFFFSFFFEGFISLPRKTKCWTRIMCVLVLVYRQLLCLFERTKRFMKQLWSSRWTRLPSPFRPSSRADRVAFGMPDTLPGTLSNNFPSLPLPPLSCPPACRHLGYCCSSSFFAFDFIAN